MEVNSRKFRLAFLQANRTFGDTCLVPTVSFLQFFGEIHLVVETMLKNIRCFIDFISLFIVILVLSSFSQTRDCIFIFRLRM